MTMAQSTHDVHSQADQQTGSRSAPAYARTLGTESDELATLHVGLQRHAGAWRAAHESAVESLTSVLQRMDAILERFDRNRG
jgi:hypothetical protein